MQRGRWSILSREDCGYKDSVLVDLFYSDGAAGKDRLGLYNELHGTDLEYEGLKNLYGVRQSIVRKR